MPSTAATWPLAAQEVLPLAPRYGFAGSCRAAMEFGGDLFDVVPLGDGSTLMVMADVMGKGLPASLFAASLRKLVREVARGPGGPAQWLAELNQRMFDELSTEDTFITLQLVLANLFTRELNIANAGHCPLLISNGADAPMALAPEGMPLGIDPDAIFGEKRIQLSPFSAVLLYTDGVTEAQDMTGAMFGQDRLESWFHQAVAVGCSSVELKQNLLCELREFQGSDSPADDQTFLVFADETPRRAKLHRLERPAWPMRSGVRTMVDGVSFSNESLLESLTLTAHHRAA